MVRPQPFTLYLRISEYIDEYMIELHELFVEDFYIAWFAEALQAVEHVAEDEVYCLDSLVCLGSLTLEELLKANLLFFAALKAQNRFLLALQWGLKLSLQFY